jgi:uncharacterized protein YdhG (YjbR/CyaY superfamily)
MSAEKAASMDAYIASLPQHARKAMEQIRSIINEMVPEAEEAISYGMPTFKLHGRYLVYFAAYKNHIGFYPAPVNNEVFKKDLAGYKTGKGSVQFPLDKSMPVVLILKILRFRINENLQQTKS